MNRHFLAVILAFSINAAWADTNSNPLPDSKLTPGVTNPKVTAQSIDVTICVPGYTKTIRPPASFTDQLKKKQIKQYGYKDRNPSHYEEDHLISLELGGNPTDPKNLWPQPRNIAMGAAQKDKLENELHKRVCAKQITLHEAQHEIATDWVGAYKKYGVH